MIRQTARRVSLAYPLCIALFFREATTSYSDKENNIAHDCTAAVLTSLWPKVVVLGKVHRTLQQVPQHGDTR
jgi:hypothetical protein